MRGKVYMNITEPYRGIKQITSGLSHIPLNPPPPGDNNDLSLKSNILISFLKECPVRLWHLKNGRFHGNGSVYLSTYHFLCNGGYVLVGDSTVTCTADGSWNGTKPVCLRGIKFSLNTLKRFLRKGESGIND